jgi:hypothetical protein
VLHGTLLVQMDYKLHLHFSSRQSDLGRSPKESPDQSRGALLCGAGLNRLVQILDDLI